MNPIPFIDRLEAHAPILAAVLGRIPPDAAGWKPAPEQWSILEVAAHLLDEEREDFRVRLDLVLHDPEASWPPIDPAGWVTARAYASWDLKETVQSFLEERERSVAWLRGLPELDCERAHHHPKFGTMRAGDLLASWATHDLLHIRQITRLEWQRLVELARPHGVDYAGPW